MGPRAGPDDMKRKFLPLPGLELRTLGLPACSVVAIPTELSLLPQFGVADLKNESFVYPKGLLSA
jgi:hypothetical protein